jgi:hypothetical protein
MPLLEDATDRGLGEDESLGDLGLGHPCLMSGDDPLAKVQRKSAHKNSIQYFGK